MTFPHTNRPVDPPAAPFLAPRKQDPAHCLEEKPVQNQNGGPDRRDDLFWGGESGPRSATWFLSPRSVREGARMISTDLNERNRL